MQMTISHNFFRFNCVIIVFLFVLNTYAQENQDESDSTGVISKTELIIMKDGIKLATDVYLPSENGTYPAILVRTPYNKAGIKKGAEKLAAEGYVVVVQDCRGKFLSEGAFYPFKHERADGLETVKWIKAQEWSNGKIGGWGGSYVGYTQWAVSDVLDVISPELTSADMYGLMYPGGMFSLATAFNWGLLVAAQTVNPVAPEKILASYSILPLSVADDSTTKDINFINDWLTHSDKNEYWKFMDHRGIASSPVISVAGWYDIFIMPQILDFQALPENVRLQSRLIIGPWCHGKQAYENDYGGSEKTGHRQKLIGRFMKKHLQDTGFDFSDLVYKDKIYNLFVMERNEYYGCNNWPPKSTVETEYFLGPDHYFAPHKPKGSGKLEYTYNPSDPYPNRGGTFLGMGVGAALQNDNESRSDQLIFETTVLESPLILLGPISATLYVGSNVPSTGFIICLQDVFPNGNVINIQEGGSKVDLEEGINKIDVSVWSTGYQLNQGHKLRAVITSSWFPRFNRNLNSGEPIFSAQTINIADQAIYFGKNSSSITLPILNVSDDSFSED